MKKHDEDPSSVPLNPYQALGTRIPDHTPESERARTNLMVEVGKGKMRDVQMTHTELLSGTSGVRGFN